MVHLLIVTLLGTTGGPTPGNAAFALYLPATINYVSLHNSIDIVPHSWQSSDMVKIPGIYAPNIPAPPAVIVLTTEMIARAAKVLPSFYLQSPVWTAVHGTFDTATDTAVENALAKLESEYPDFAAEIKAMTNFVRFLGQAGYQHTKAYDTLLNIQ